MDTSSGWVSVYRSLFDSPFYNDKPFDRTHAFIDLLMLANHKDMRAYKDGEIVVMKRGTVNRSITSLADRWGWDRKKVKKFLCELEALETTTTKTTTHGTTITIVNYDIYQFGGSTDGQPTGQPFPNHSPTIPQPFPTNNNVIINNSNPSYHNAHARERRVVHIIDDTKER